MDSLDKHIEQLVESKIASMLYSLTEEMQKQKEIIQDLRGQQEISQYITLHELHEMFGFSYNTLEKIRREQKWIVEMRNGKGTPYFDRATTIKKLRQRNKERPKDKIQ